MATSEFTQAQKTRAAHILISRYIALYKQVHGRTPTVNRYAAKWGMIDVIDSVGVDRAEKILDHYFKTAHPEHDIEFFYRKFDKIEQNLIAVRQDREQRARIMAETAQRVKEEEDKQRSSSIGGGMPE